MLGESRGWEYSTIRDLLLSVLSNKEKQQSICATFDHQNLVFEQLTQSAYSIAASLKSYDLVGICMRPSFELIITLCAVVLRGIPYVPLEPSLPCQRLQYMINDSQISLMIIEDSFVDQYHFENVKTMTYSQMNSTMQINNSEMNQVNSEDTFCLMYTSGSTGQPKGVHLPHRALLNRLQWQWSRFPFDEQDICCLKTSISFVDSIGEIFAALLQFVPIVILPKTVLLNLEQLTDVLRTKYVTRIILVPSLLAALVEHLKVDNVKSLPNLRMITSSGGVLSLDLIESFFKIKNNKLSSTCLLLNLYGSTEVMADVTFEIFDSIDNLYEQLSFDGHTSIGRPIDNINIEIVDMDECGVGELVVRGQGVANGYHRQHTDSKFIRDNQGNMQFYTGDLGKIFNDRVIFYGRQDNQIKIAGNRIDLSEIELVLKRHFNCHQPVVLYLSKNETIVVFLQENELVSDLTRSNLSEYLPSYAIPAQFITIPQIPYLVSGKIDRQSLINSMKTKEKQTNSSKPKDLLLQALDEIGISQEHIHENFLSAGGSSLNAILLVVKLHRHGFHDLTVERLLNAKSLEEILTYSHQNQSTKNNYFGDSNHQYEVIGLAEVDKNEALQIVMESFANFNEFDALLHRNRPELKIECKKTWHRLLSECWSTYVENGLSFGVIDLKTGHLVGVSLSNDLAHEVHFDLSIIPMFVPIFELIETGENQLIENLRSKTALPQRILHNFLSAADSNLEPKHRITVMHFLEQQLLHIAERNHFQGVLTANSSNLTQQLAEHVFKYDVIQVLHASQWCNSAGIRVFPDADDNRVMTICFKYIRKIEM